MNRLAPFLSEGSPPGQRPGGLETVKKAAKTLFREKPYAGWSSTPSGKVGPPCGRSVISDAYVAGNDGIKFYSVACGWRNSSQESFFHKPRRPPHLRRPPCSCSTAALPAGSRALTASCTAWQPLPLRRRCPGRLSPGAAAWTCQSSPPAPAPAGGPAAGRPLRC